MSGKQVATYDSNRVAKLNEMYFQGYGGDLQARICRLEKGKLGSAGLFAGSKPIFYTDAHLWVTDRKCGSGASTTAYHAKIYKLGNNEVTECVIKVAGRSFVDQAELLKKVDPTAQTIDRFQWAVHQGKVGIASCAVSECDLAHFNFANGRKPVTFITGQLLNYTDGLARLHAADLIHRDVKGANLLVNHNKPGCLTDFDLMSPLLGPRSVATTRAYASPAIWGSLKNQWQRRGRQKKVDDLFAFGRTIQRDVLQSLLEAKGVDVSGFKPHVYERKYTDDSDLDKLEDEFPGRVILHSKHRDGHVAYWVYPERGELFQLTVKSIGQLNEDEVECEKLRRLAALARDLTSPDRAEICRALGVKPSRAKEGGLLMGAVRRRLEAIQEGSGILTTKVSRYHLHSVIGRGGANVVIRAERYSLRGGRPSVKIVKSSDESFKSQMQRVKKIGVNNTLDVIREIFSRDGVHYAVCEVSEGDLFHFDLGSCDDPIGFLLSQSTDWADGLAHIHKSGQVHRDIKAENLLVNSNGSGRVTDFGALTDLQRKKHFTLTTPHVAAPFIWDSLFDQYLANLTDPEEWTFGHHSKGADVFAFGRTLFSDVVLKILMQFTGDYEVDDIDFGQFRPKSFRKSFRTESAVREEISRLADKYPGRIAMDLEQENHAVRYVRFPDRNRAYVGVSAIIDQFDEVLSKEDCERLRELAKLATGLLSPTKKELCQFLGVRMARENECDLLMRNVKERLKAIIEGQERNAKRFKSKR